MQELITYDRSPVPVARAARRFDKVQNEKEITDVQEALNDLIELRYLISVLNSSEELSPNSDLKESVRLLEARHRRHLDLVERASRWGTTPDVRSLLNAVRKDYLQTKSKLRAAYRQNGTMLCATDWQSPVYSSSMHLELNRLSDGISEHSWDYKRDGHLDALCYENKFVDEYLSHLNSNHARAYLANSGMAGFTTVLHWLAHESYIAGPAVALVPMYFENMHLTGAFFPALEQLRTPSPVDLLKYLRDKNPSIVFCDAVTNCGDVLEHHLDVIFEWASREAPHDVALVIDTTCLPMPLLPSDLLFHLPKNVCVFLVESLAKHHQFGMDSVTGGIVVAHMPENMQANFQKTRARIGTNITDSSVGALPMPNRERLLKRMQRHSRNIQLLANSLETLLPSHNGIMESVSWLKEGTTFCPWFAGSCLTIRLQKPYRSIQAYRQFEQKVMELCIERNHPVSFGTSFGFDVSRFYVTAPATRFEEPFLRVAIGTETREEIETLVDILHRASFEVKQGTIRTPDAESAIVPSVLHGRPDPLSTVFAGDEGLKNYLTPANYTPTPLVELPADLNPFKADGVRLFAKMVPLVPLMNIKSIPAYSMLSKAAERGELEGVKNLIESSSSNTVLSLSVLGKLFGIDNTCAIVDHSIAPSLTRMLRLFGIEIFLHPAAGHELFGIMEPRSERARVAGSQPSWLNPGQYTNPDNPEGFAQWLAPDLWAQTQGRLSILSCGLGTCGTMVGVSRALRERNPDIEVVACCPKAGDAVPGPREKSLLGDVTFQWAEVPNATVELTCTESFTASVTLLRRGILGGPSSGMNYAGALRYLQQARESGRLKQMVRENGDIYCAFLCCDSPLPHVDEYYDALGDQFFPSINEVPSIGGN